MASAAAGTAPLAIYMGRRGARGVQRRLVLQGRSPDTPVILVESAGRRDEARRHATLGQLADAVETLPGDGPLMILVAMRSRELVAQSVRKLEAA